MDANEHELKTLLAKGETLTVEFKSDAKSLPDRDLVATVVALVNTEGGLILLGVEDDGTVTGVQPSHQDAAGLIALIANRTSPSVSVRVQVISWGDKRILDIQVPKSRGIVSTSYGLLLRRRLMASGKPEAVPFYPHVSIGWDTNPRFKELKEDLVAGGTPDLFTDFLRRAMKFVDAGGLSPRLITVNSWNEWSEGWINPEPASYHTLKRIAVVGSGPAGLAAAQQLTRSGHTVTVFDCDDRIGGVLRYGIPDFALEKRVLDRRLDQLIGEGVGFETGVDVGVDMSFHYLQRTFDAVIVLTGSRIPKDIIVTTPEEARIRRKIVGTIEYPAFREGKVLYAKRR
jgi:hypothetical protein